MYSTYSMTKVLKLLISLRRCTSNNNEMLYNYLFDNLNLNFQIQYFYKFHQK